MRKTRRSRICSQNWARTSKKQQIWDFESFESWGVGTMTEKMRNVTLSLMVLCVFDGSR